MIFIIAIPQPQSTVIIHYKGLTGVTEKCFFKLNLMSAVCGLIPQLSNLHSGRFNHQIPVLLLLYISINIKIINIIIIITIIIVVVIILQACGISYEFKLLDMIQFHKKLLTL